MKNVFAITFLLTLQAFMPASAKDLIDIAMACGQDTHIKNEDRLQLKTDDGSIACVDAESYLRDVSIREAQLRYSESLDLYMLFLFVDQSDRLRLGEFSRVHLNSRMYIVKDGIVMVSAWLGAPMTNGYINIGVPDKARGTLLMDKLVPPIAGNDARP